MKREDLNHLGSHKLNNVLGQILLAKRMGKTRVIAETEQVNTVSLQQLRQLSLVWPVMSTWGRRRGTSTSQCLPHGNDGATVHAVETGTKTLKDAVDAAFGAWMADLMLFTFWVLLLALTLTQPLS